MKRQMKIGCLLAALIAGGLPAHAAPQDEAAIRKLLDNFAKAFHDKNVDAIMAMYAPGDRVVAFDVVPPLRYRGYAAYRKDYESFLAQYEGPIAVEYRDMNVVAGNGIAFAYGLERMSGTLKGAGKSTMWVRFTSCFEKIGDRWFDVHDHISVPADLEKGTAMTGLTP